jgi:hypothetical protein
MAPTWTRAIRPLVLVLTTIAFIVTVVFRADVNAQGGAYATGVLVLITSASVAVTLSARRRGRRRLTAVFTVVTVIFVYTTIANIIERPDGVKIASLFIAGIIVFSVLSRIVRATELRATGVEMDELARRFIEDAAAQGEIHIIANEPQARDEAEYREKEAEQRRDQHIPEDVPVLFVEVKVTDPSDFEAPLRVRGEERYGYRILRVEGPSISNAIAALLLCIRDLTGKKPHVYFNWTEGNPVVYLLRYLLFGEGEIAPLTREILREAEHDYRRRPMVHVG